MADKWINMGHEDEELSPYVEPPKDCFDISRIGQLRIHYVFRCTEYTRVVGNVTVHSISLCK